MQKIPTMHLTPEQIAKIRQKEAVTPDARNQRSKNWTLARVLGAIAADPWIGRNPEKCLALQDNVTKRLKRLPDDANALALDYVGFSERYKPGGKAFYSTAESRHVQMTCWSYKYWWK